MSAAPAPPWYRRAFGRLYLTVYSHRDDPSARSEVEFAAEALQVREGERLLDAGCGGGRHARALAARGAQVVGIDLSADLLTDAVERGGAPRYVLADFRALPLRGGGFDHVMSFFTAFGYFDDAGNERQLREFRHVVRDGGGLLLDFLNAPRVRATLVAHSSREVAGLVVREERAIREDRVEKSVELTDPSAARTEKWSESVRLYEREELERMLSAAGFGVRRVYGDLAGGEWSRSADRLVVVARAR